MTKEQPYIRIETTIRDTLTGTVATHKLIEKSSNLPDDFIESLYEDYGINIDEIEPADNRMIDPDEGRAYIG